ncbi:hypothetical protein ACQPZF_23005 [Actinosynnema sp. CS-041913]|uniref:hypothetical protein n=1 Tax=Actinosynnema sp. CS-041913 TaxID=3239917 RepID=UPI003D91FA0E
MADDQVSVGARLADVVRERAAVVLSALRDGPVVEDGWDASDPLVVAATRVLGADVLAAHTLLGREPAETEVALAQAAVAAFPADTRSSTAGAWTYWGLCAALRSAGRAGPGVSALAPPDAGWARTVPWPVLTHRLAQVAAVAVPKWHCPLAEAAAGRVPDVARGFVRAVRRRDWSQAAGAGRWLAVLGGFPESLGLDAGLTFVGHLAAGDPRVELQVRAARLIREASA